jgi:hypothetical protein
MVILGHFASLSIWGVADLLQVSLGATYLTWSGGARIPLRETREVAYFAQVTSPNLLVVTLISFSLSTAGSNLVP